MCGIVGYVGRSEAAPILLDGLRRGDTTGNGVVNSSDISYTQSQSG